MSLDGGRDMSPSISGSSANVLGGGSVIGCVSVGFSLSGVLELISRFLGLIARFIGFPGFLGLSLSLNGPPPNIFFIFSYIVF